MPLVRSALLRRQYECLSVAVELVNVGHGFAAVGLLRPACEEMLWAKYLGSINRKDAERLLRVMARKELADSLKAQDDHVGHSTTEQLGLSQYMKQMTAAAEYRNRELKSLGTKLRWEKRTIENAQLPSIAFIAKAVGDLKTYRFLYHASSRYVHFSPAELLRRAWGEDGFDNCVVSAFHRLLGFVRPLLGSSLVV